MARPTPIAKLELHGFNNLTKSLSFNIYDICYTQTDVQRDQYIEYIHEAYNAERLTEILIQVSDIIGATVLNVARQDYLPQGASVAMLIAEEPLHMGTDGRPLRADAVVHLDKSHITVHTYPESHPTGGLSTFRADIDVATCGEISPLKALNHLIDSFDSDIVIVDYRVRGFTRDTRGRKHFMDHKMDSIQQHVSRDTRRRYQMMDVNVYQENLFHTKMMLNQFDLDDYLFAVDKDDLPSRERRHIERRLRREMEEIFYSQNQRGA